MGLQDRLQAYTFANSQGNETIPQPVLSILPTQVRVVQLLYSKF